MTNWLNTLMTRRNPSTRHLGAGMDADTLRMAHELSLMEQGATKAERLELLRSSSRAKKTAKDDFYVQRRTDRYVPVVTHTR